MKQHIPDLLLVMGAASVAYGAWLAYPAAGFVTGGCLALLAGFITSRKAG